MIPREHIMKNLAQWKESLIDVREARKRAIMENQSTEFVKELSGAVRFALCKIHEIELIVFKIGEL